MIWLKLAKMDKRKIGRSCNIIVFGCLAWKEEDGGSGAWKQRKRTNKYIPTPPQWRKSNAPNPNSIFVSFFSADPDTRSIYRKWCVLKFLSPQNLGNFSFKESSKLKREITVKNLEGKFQSWLIKILKFNTWKPNVRSMNSKLQFEN